MSMNDLDLLTNDDISEDGEKGEDGRECGLSIDDHKRDMVNLEAIHKVTHACSTFVIMSDDNDFMASINQLRRELVDVTFNSAGLGEEHVTDHGDIVRHLGDCW